MLHMKKGKGWEWSLKEKNNTPNRQWKMEGGEISGPGPKVVLQCEARSLSQPLQPNMARNEILTVSEI